MHISVCVCVFICVHVRACVHHGALQGEWGACVLRYLKEQLAGAIDKQFLLVSNVMLLTTVIY